MWLCPETSKYVVMTSMMRGWSAIARKGTRAVSFPAPRTVSRTNCLAGRSFHQIKLNGVLRKAKYIMCQQEDWQTVGSMYYCSTQATRQHSLGGWVVLGSRGRIRWCWASSFTRSQHFELQSLTLFEKLCRDYKDMKDVVAKRRWWGFHRQEMKGPENKGMLRFEYFGLQTHKLRVYVDTPQQLHLLQRFDKWEKGLLDILIFSRDSMRESLWGSGWVGNVKHEVKIMVIVPSYSLVHVWWGYKEVRFKYMVYKAVEERKWNEN